MAGFKAVEKKLPLDHWGVRQQQSLTIASGVRHQLIEGLGETQTMRHWLKASLTFLFWLATIQLARLMVVLLCVSEILLVLVLWPLAFIEAHHHNTWLYVLMPVGMTLLVAVQVALWQFMWLRIAQRGGHCRALAECFSRVVRYPVVREPHPWE